MSDARRSPTLADVAREAAVSTYTASVALRGGMGKVRAATMERVAAAAERLGYRANGPAALLARQRRRDISPERAVRVGVIGRVEERGEHYFEVMRAAAPGLGLEMVFLDGGGPGGLAGLLQAAWSQGIEGLCLPSRSLPWSVEEIEAADWSRFVVVQRDRSDTLRGFHLVRVSAFDFMLMTLEKVLAGGYRRVGVMMAGSRARRDDLARLGAVMALREEVESCGGWLGIFRGAPGAADVVPGVREWLLSNRPDALVAFPFAWYRAVEAAGFRIPEDVALAAVLTHPQVDGLRHISGCHAAEEELARRCLERLLALLRSGERGRVPHPLEDVIEPTWFEGETLGRKGEG